MTEPSPPTEMPSGSARPHLWTVIAIALVAYAACDMVHEVAGHGLACALTGVRAQSLSTVALQTESSSRLVAAAGSIANVVVGVLALLLFRRSAGSGATRYFLWLFASLNLLNGTGYLIFSGILDVGDLAVVISGCEPHAAWRAILVIAGVASYGTVVRVISTHAASLVSNRGADAEETRRLVMPAYLAGGLLFVAGSALNPIGPSLILLSGVSSGFGAMAGLVAVPWILSGRRLASPGSEPPASLVGFSRAWVVVGALVALGFVFILGPGIKL